VWTALPAEVIGGGHCESYLGCKSTGAVRSFGFVLTKILILQGLEGRYRRLKRLIKILFGDGDIENIV